MSWEEGIKKTRVCSCGKGTIVTHIEFDDWNRQRSYEEILCEYCKEQKRKEDVQKAKVEQKYHEDIINVIRYIKKYYLKDWLDYFEDIKTKKGLWNIVISMGIERCSLNTFYKWYKYRGKEKYLKDLIKIENLLPIIKLLNIQDEELIDNVNNILIIQEQRKSSSYNEVYRNYRKK